MWSIRARFITSLASKLYKIHRIPCIKINGKLLRRLIWPIFTQVFGPQLHVKYQKKRECNTNCTNPKSKSVKNSSQEQHPLTMKRENRELETCIDKMTYLHNTWMKGYTKDWEWPFTYKSRTKEMYLEITLKKPRNYKRHLDTWTSSRNCKRLP